MRHHVHSALFACAAVIVLACAGCQLKRINARTFTLTSTLSIGIGDLAPGCHFADGETKPLLPVRSSVHFTADVSDDRGNAPAPMAEKAMTDKAAEKSTCSREHHPRHSAKDSAVKVD